MTDVDLQLYVVIKYEKKLLQFIKYNVNHQRDQRLSDSQHLKHAHYYHY